MQMKKNNNTKSFWIGIGASAGGLEALKELVSDLEAKNAIYIIAQHLDPKHPTILKDLLERETKMPINMIDNDIKPNPGEIYIISPGHNAVIVNEEIRLQPAATVGPKPSINEFFTSLAQDIAERSIGVILSGTGSDGAEGIVAIKAAGGIALAQDEVSAKYPSMPRAAIDTGVVDFILSPKDITQEVKSFLNTLKISNNKFSGPKVRSNLEKIFQRLYDQTNYDFSGYKLKTIQRRIQRRMVVNKVITLDDYITLLMSSSTEVENLFKELLISVTAFFRDPDSFEVLHASIKQTVQEANDGESLRVWVPGCAKGEEAYSIGILIQEEILSQSKEIDFQVFATDIDDSALSKARQGLYSYEQVKEIDKHLLTRYFSDIDTIYSIKKELRDHMVFAKQNLIMDPPFSHLDLISCRNVMIYFNLETQKKVFQIFHFALKNEGHLFLGKSESASNIVPELFETTKSGSQIFKRRMIDINRKSDYIQSANMIATPTVEKGAQSVSKFKKVQSIRDKMNEVLIDQILPASIVINSQGKILYVKGDVNRYLEVPEGKIDTNILTMAKDNLKIDIRSLMQKAKLGENVSAQALFYSAEAEAEILYLSMLQFEMEENSNLFILAFFNIKISDSVQTPVLPHKLKEHSNEQLKKELEIFRSRLESSIQDLEISNEELQSSNEELQSANEELQSANEELQTANEELQSTNEELSTVNEELEIKSFELGQVNNDLESMLSSIDEVILFVDTRLRIHRYTKKAATIFKLKREDVGQIITSYDLAVDIPNIRLELLNILETQKESIIEIHSQDASFNLRLVAYKAEDNEVVGVILFFEKIAKLNEPFYILNTHFMELLNLSSNKMILLVNKKQEIVYANKILLNTLGYSAEEINELKMNDIVAQSYLPSDFFTQMQSESDIRTVVAQTKASKRISMQYQVKEYPDLSYASNLILLDFSEKIDEYAKQ